MGQIRRALLGRVLGVYVTASFARLQILDVLADRLKLPDREWYLTLADYYSIVQNAPERAATAYRMLLSLSPDDPAAQVDLARLARGRMAIDSGGSKRVY